MRLLVIATLILLSIACSKDDPQPPPAPALTDVDTLGNWQFKKIDTLGRALADVTFTDANTGFACGERNALFKTSDGGTTWQPIVLNSSSDYSNIRFLSSQYGFITSNRGSGPSGVLRTTNGGVTWQLGATPTSAIDVFFLNPSFGFCTTSASGLLKSVDSGKTWVAVPSTTLSTTSSLWFFDASRGFVTAQSGNVFRTTDGGASFSVAAYNVGYSYSPLYFANATNGCAGLGSAVYITNDGGTTWQMLKQFSNSVLDVKNIGSADYYVSTAREVWHTTNGGAAWVREMKLAVNNEAIEFTLTQPGRIWASGGNGRLYYK